MIRALIRVAILHSAEEVGESLAYPDSKPIVSKTAPIVEVAVQWFCSPGFVQVLTKDDR